MVREARDLQPWQERAVEDGGRGQARPGLAEAGERDTGAARGVRRGHVRFTRSRRHRLAAAEHPPPALPSGLEDPSQALLEAYATGQKVWADVPLSYLQFCAYLLGCGDGPLPTAHPAELYLCAACALGRPRAHRELEKTYFPPLRLAIRALVRDRYAVEDVLQEVRSRLFVGSEPRIASYRGSGSLCGWLRSVAVHAAQDYLRASKSSRQRLQRLADAQRIHTASHAAWTPPSDERAFRSDFSRACQRAWRAAVHSLTSMERKLLHHHFVSGLSIDILGKLYGVHRATVARRIRRAAERLSGRVRAALSARYRDWSGPALDALAREACGELDLAGLLG